VRRPARSGERSRLAACYVLVVVVAALAFGIFTRIWYLTHVPMNSDEAVVGLMAQQILHGHFSAFYWGQNYGGAEPYLVAGIFGVFGSSVLALQLVPILLSAVAALLTWQAAHQLTGNGALAVLAGAAVWALPQSAVLNSTQEYGFRGVTMVCGMAMIVLTLHATRAERVSWALVPIGFAAGIGWWSSPEIVYFALPCALWLAAWVWCDRPALSALLPRLGAGVAAAGVGALPWLWANVGNGFSSLDTGALPVPTSSPANAGYVAHLGLFARDVFPLVLDLRVSSTGTWVLYAPVAIGLTVIAALAMVGTMAIVVARRARAWPLVVALLAFPFLWSVPAAVWQWSTGRYSTFLVPLGALVLIAGVQEWGKRPLAAHLRKPAHRWVPVVLLGLLALSATNFVALWPTVDPSGSGAAGGDPNLPARHMVAQLEQAGVHEGFAEYWVAYKLDFLSGGALRMHLQAPTVGEHSSLRFKPHPRASRRGCSCV
jgi:Dolichyl-phosphate-mannose-protein mannosyltransferase